METNMGTGNGKQHPTRDVEERALPVKLTEVELVERGTRMADAELAIERLKSERKSLNADIKTQVDLRAQLAHTIDSGHEQRQVRCAWIEDYPKNCWRLIRQDTGELVDTRPMTAQDLQGSLVLEQDDEVEAAEAAAEMAEYRASLEKPFLELEIVDVGHQTITLPTAKRRTGKSRDITAEIKARRKRGKKKTSNGHAHA